jgi:hypothetical protein
VEVWIKNILYRFMKGQIHFSTSWHVNMSLTLHNWYTMFFVQTSTLPPRNAPKTYQTWKVWNTNSTIDSDRVRNWEKSFSLGREKDAHWSNNLTKKLLASTFNQSTHGKYLSWLLLALLGRLSSKQVLCLECGSSNIFSTSVLPLQYDTLGKHKRCRIMEVSSSRYYDKWHIIVVLSREYKT